MCIATMPACGDGRGTSQRLRARRLAWLLVQEKTEASVTCAESGEASVILHVHQAAPSKEACSLLLTVSDLQAVACQLSEASFQIQVWQDCGLPSGDTKTHPWEFVLHIVDCLTSLLHATEKLCAADVMNRAELTASFSSIASVKEEEQRRRRVFSDWASHFHAAMRQYPALALLSYKDVGDCRRTAAAAGGISKALCKRYPFFWDSEADRTHPFTGPPENGNWCVADWLEYLGGYLQDQMRVRYFSRLEQLATPQPDAFSMLSGKGATPEALFCTVPGDPSKTTEERQLLWCLAFYVRAMGRLPYFFELLLCSPETSAERVDRYLEVWRSYSRSRCNAERQTVACPSFLPPLFCVVNGERLPPGQWCRLRDSVRTAGGEESSLTGRPTLLVFCDAKDESREESGELLQVKSADVTRTIQTARLGALCRTSFPHSLAVRVRAPPTAALQCALQAQVGKALPCALDGIRVLAVPCASVQGILTTLFTADQERGADWPAPAVVGFVVSSTTADAAVLNALLSLLVCGVLYDGETVIVRKPDDLYVIVLCDDSCLCDDISDLLTLLNILVEKPEPTVAVSLELINEGTGSCPWRIAAQGVRRGAVAAQALLCSAAVSDGLLPFFPSVEELEGFIRVGPDGVWLPVSFATGDEAGAVVIDTCSPQHLFTIVAKVLRGGLWRRTCVATAQRKSPSTVDGEDAADAYSSCGVHVHEFWQLFSEHVLEVLQWPVYLESTAACAAVEQLCGAELARVVRLRCCVDTAIRHIVAVSMKLLGCDSAQSALTMSDTPYPPLWCKGGRVTMDQLLQSELCTFATLLNGNRGSCDEIVALLKCFCDSTGYENRGAEETPNGLSCSDLIALQWATSKSTLFQALSMGGADGTCANHDQPTEKRSSTALSADHHAPASSSPPLRPDDTVCVPLLRACELGTEHGGDGAELMGGVVGVDSVERTGERLSTTLSTAHVRVLMTMKFLLSAGFHVLLTGGRGSGRRSLAQLFAVASGLPFKMVYCWPETTEKDLSRCVDELAAGWRVSRERHVQKAAAEVYNEPRLLILVNAHLLQQHGGKRGLPFRTLEVLKSRLPDRAHFIATAEEGCGEHGLVRIEVPPLGGWCSARHLTFSEHGAVSLTQGKVIPASPGAPPVAVMEGYGAVVGSAVQHLLEKRVFPDAVYGGPRSTHGLTSLLAVDNTTALLGEMRQLLLRLLVKHARGARAPVADTKAHGASTHLADFVFHWTDAVAFFAGIVQRLRPQKTDFAVLALTLLSATLFTDRVWPRDRQRRSSLTALVRRSCYSYLGSVSSIQRAAAITIVDGLTETVYDQTLQAVSAACTSAVMQHSMPNEWAECCVATLFAAFAQRHGGVVLRGAHGSGKTHLLHLLQQSLHALASSPHPADRGVATGVRFPPLQLVTVCCSSLTSAAEIKKCAELVVSSNRSPTSHAVLVLDNVTHKDALPTTAVGSALCVLLRNGLVNEDTGEVEHVPVICTTALTSSAAVGTGALSFNLPDSDSDLLAKLCGPVGNEGGTTAEKVWRKVAALVVDWYRSGAVPGVRHHCRLAWRDVEGFARTARALGVGIQDWSEGVGDRWPAWRHGVLLAMLMNFPIRPTDEEAFLSVAGVALDSVHAYTNADGTGVEAEQRAMELRWQEVNTGEHVCSACRTVYVASTSRAVEDFTKVVRLFHDTLCSGVLLGRPEGQLIRLRCVVRAPSPCGHSDHPSIPSRHAMVVGDTTSSLHLLQGASLLKPPERCTMVFNERGHTNRTVGPSPLATISSCTEGGRDLVLVGALKEYYPLLSEVLTQDYTKANGGDLTPLEAVIASHEASLAVKVQSTFRVVVVMDEKAYSELDTSVRSRFSVLQLSYQGLLPPAVVKWATALFHRFDTRTDVGGGREPTNLLPVLIPGLSLDTILSLALAVQGDGADEAKLLRHLRWLVSPSRLVKHTCPHNAQHTELESRALPAADAVVSPSFECFGDGLHHKDCLSDAFLAYVTDFPEARHAVVFSSQRWHDRMTTTEHAAKLCTAWHSAVGADVPEKAFAHGSCSRLTAAASQTRDLCLLASSELEDLFQQIRADLEHCAHHDPIPLVFYIDVCRPSCASVACVPLGEQLTRLQHAMRTSGVDTAGNRLRVAVIVLSADTGSFADELTQWRFLSTQWAYLTVDEVYASEWTELQPTQPTPMEESNGVVSNGTEQQQQNTSRTQPPLFRLDDVYSKRRSPLRVLCEQVDCLPSLLRHHTAALAQALCDFRGSPRGVHEWCDGLYKLFSPHHPIGTLAVSCVAASYHEFEKDVTHSTAAEEALLKGATFSHSTASSLRSYLFTVAVHAFLHAMSQVLAALFFSPQELHTVVDATTTGPLFQRLVAHVLGMDGSSGATLRVDWPLAITAAVTQSEVVFAAASASESRRRQPLFAWPRLVLTAESTSPLLFPFSYFVFQLTRMSGDPWRALHDALHGTDMENTEDAKEAERGAVEQYTHDALLFFFADDRPLSEQGFRREVAWLVSAIIALHYRHTAAVEPGEVLNGKGNDFVEAVVALRRAMTYEANWLTAAFAWANTVYRGNGDFVRWLRAAVVQQGNAFEFPTAFTEDDFIVAVTMSRPWDSLQSRRGLPRRRLRPSVAELSMVYPLLHHSADRWRVGVYLLSYSVFALPPEEERTRDCGGTNEDDADEGLLQSFLDLAGESLDGVCRWLSSCASAGDNADKVGCVTREGAKRALATPLLVAHAYHHCMMRMDGPSGRESGDAMEESLWPSFNETLLHTVTTCRTAGSVCPPHVLFFLVRHALRRWLKDALRQVTVSKDAADGSADLTTEAEDKNRPQALPLCCLSELCAHDMGQTVSLVVVEATISELRAVSVGNRARLHEASGILWRVVMAHTAPPATFTERSLAFCLAIGTLQSEVQSIAAVSGGDDDTAETGQQLSLHTRFQGWLHDFTARWTTYVEECGVTGSALADISRGALLLLVRTLSNNGLELTRARALLPQLLPTSLTQSPLVLDVMGNETWGPMLRVLLKPSFIADGVPFSSAKHQDLLLCVEQLSVLMESRVSPGDGRRRAVTDPPSDPLLRAFCVAFQRWWESGDYTAKWDSEARLTLAAILLYFLAGEEDNSFVKAVARRERDIALQLPDIRLSSHGTSDAAKAEAIARFTRAAAAFGAQILAPVLTEDEQQQQQEADGSRPARCPDGPGVCTAATKTRIAWCAETVLPHCPVCHRLFVDFEACTALFCTCGAGFCGWCLADTKGDPHPHVRRCRYNPARPEVHCRRDLWCQKYAEAMLGPRVAALEQGQFSYGLRESPDVLPPSSAVDAVAIPAPTPWTFGEELPETQRPTTEELVENHLLLRYKAYETFTNSDTMFPTTLMDDRGAMMYLCDRLPSVPLTRFAVAAEELDRAVEQLGEAFVEETRGSRTYALLLKFMLGFFSRSNLKEATADVRATALGHSFGFKQTVARVDELASDASNSQSLTQALTWGPVYDASVRVAIRQNEPGAALPYLFDVLHPTPASEVERDALHSPAGGALLSELTHLQASFSVQAAERLRFVLQFAFDARCVVRGVLRSLREIRAHRLAFLTEQNPILFPRDRTERFIQTVKHMLMHLERADNNCHQDQHYTIAAGDTPEEVNLEECLLVSHDGNGNLLDLLFTGTDEVAGRGVHHVGYGNADHGQNSILALADSAASRTRPSQDARESGSTSEDDSSTSAQRRGTTPNCPLILCSQDVVQYDPLWTQCLLDVCRHTGLRPLHVAATPLSPKMPVEADKWIERHGLCDSETIVRGVLSHPGLVARPRLSELPLMELGTAAVLNALSGVMDYIERRLDATDEQLPPTLTASPDGAIEEVPEWSARGRQTVRRIVQRYSGAEHLSAHSVRQRLFAFLVQYVNYYASLFQRYSYEDPLVGSELAQPFPPPLPPFALLPLAALPLETQQDGQRWIAEEDAADVAVLLLESFDGTAESESHALLPTAVDEPTKPDEGRVEAGGAVDGATQSAYQAAATTGGRATRDTLQRLRRFPDRVVEVRLTLKLVELAATLSAAPPESTVRHHLEGFFSREELREVIAADTPLSSIPIIVKECERIIAVQTEG